MLGARIIVTSPNRPNSARDNITHGVPIMDIGLSLGLCRIQRPGQIKEYSQVEKKVQERGRIVGRREKSRPSKKPHKASQPPVTRLLAKRAGCVASVGAGQTPPKLSQIQEESGVSFLTAMYLFKGRKGRGYVLGYV